MDEIQTVDDKIKSIENEIQQNVDHYEQMRITVSLGICSPEATQTIKNMEQKMATLKQLKKTRADLIRDNDKHLTLLHNGDKKAIMVEKVRADRERRARKYPYQRELLSENLEVESRLELEQYEEENEREASDDEKSPGFCSRSAPIYEQPRRRSGGYQSFVHFKEIIRHFQGGNAPDHICEIVREMCAKYKCDPKMITPKVVKSMLHMKQQDENARHAHALLTNPNDKLKRYTDFYRNANELAHHVGGKLPPYMSPMQEERVRQLFPLITRAYQTSPYFLRQKKRRLNCTKKDPNNPNNLLLFYKICQLCGYTEFLPYIPLPKNTDNIDSKDVDVWMHVCKTYGWQYIPTR